MHGLKIVPQRAFFWDETNQTWRKAVVGEPGEYVWDETTQSWVFGTVGAEYVRSGDNWIYGPGGEYVRNTTTNTWDKVTEAGYGGRYYWDETSQSWVKNTGNPAEAASLIARMTTPPSGARADLIGELIADLKTAGVWTKLDVLYVLAAHDAQAARLNWKSSSFSLTAVNSPTFTTDRGYAGDGSTSYLDTGFKPASNGVQYTQDSASALVWSRTSAADADTARWLVGDSGNASIRVTPRSSGDATLVRINQGSTSTISSQTNGSGLFAVSRSAAAAFAVYRNGASIGTGTTASAALTSNNIYIGRGSGSGSSSVAQVAVMGLGANLSAAEHAALYTALNTYLTAVGAA